MCFMHNHVEGGVEVSLHPGKYKSSSELSPVNRVCQDNGIRNDGGQLNQCRTAFLNN